MKIPLIGGDYSALSPASQAETCINLYPERVDGVTAKGDLNPNQNGKSPGALYNTPGKHSFAALGHTNIRCLYASSGRQWSVNGTDLVEVSSVGAEITRHALPSSTGTGPASIAYNGRQVLVVDSNGTVSCDSGTGCIACTFAASSGVVTTSRNTGTCSTSGVNVVWESGSNFGLGDLLVGLTITINLVDYTIATVLGLYSITLTSSAGVQSHVDFIQGFSTVTWVSGDKFVTGGDWSGRTITIAGTDYVVLTVQPASDTILYTTTLINPDLTEQPYQVLGDAVTGTGPVVFLDGYFIIQRPSGGTPNLGRQFNISGLLDGTSWNELDFGVKESYPDDIVGLLAANEQLYIFGSESLEAWQNTGGNTDNPFPFQRIPGSISRFGAVSPWGQVALDGNVYFFGGDSSGAGSVYVLNGFTPVKISTPAEEALWQLNSYTKPYAWGYLEEGHSFYVLISDTSTLGRAYDQTTGAWHGRNDWSGSAFTVYSRQFHCFVNGGGWSKVHLVASQANGTIYQQSITFFDDAGSDVKWQRTLPYLYQENKRIIFGRFTLEMQTGTVASGAAPNVLLQWSDDRGQTFNTGLNMGAGTHNQFNVRMYVTRTGLSRGRVFRVSGVGQYKTALIDAECDLVVCS